MSHPKASAAHADTDVFPVPPVLREAPLPWTRGDGAWLLAVVLLSAALYGATVRIPMVYDDVAGVKRNRRIQKPLTVEQVASFLTSSGSNKTYRPIRDISYLIDYNLWGFGEESQAPGFHATNVLLHALCAMAVYWLLRLMYRCRLTGGAGALFFAIHPIHAEPVSLIVGRKEMLFSIFAILAFGFFLRGVQAQYRATGRSHVFIVLTAVCLFVSILSKQMSMIYPLLFILWIVLFVPPADPLGTRRGAYLARHVLPLVGVLALYIVLWQHFSEGGPIDKEKPPDPAAHFLDALWAQATYLRLMIVPRYWVIDYWGFTLGHELKGRETGEILALLAGDWRIWAMVLSLGGMLGGIALSWHWRRHPTRYGWAREVAFWGLHYLIPMLTVGNFFLRLATGLLAERYLYLPSLSVAALFGLAWSHLWNRAERRGRGALLAGSGLLAVAYGIVIVGGVMNAWTDYGIWSHALRVTPENRRAAVSTASALMHQADKLEGEERDAKRAEAERMLEALVEKHPRYTTALSSLISTRKKMGKFDTIPDLVLQNLRSNPSDAYAAKAGNEVIERLLASGQGAEAEMYLRQLLAIRVDEVDWHYQLARAYEMQGKMDKARAELTMYVLPREKGHRGATRLLRKIEASLSDDGE